MADRICALCSKSFELSSTASNYCYKLLIQGKIKYYCGYSCFRVAELQEESQKEQRLDQLKSRKRL